MSDQQTCETRFGLHAREPSGTCRPTHELTRLANFNISLQFLDNRVLFWTKQSSVTREKTLLLPPRKLLLNVFLSSGVSKPLVARASQLGFAEVQELPTIAELQVQEDTS